MAGTFVQAIGGHSSSGTTFGINLTGVGAGNHLFAAGMGYAPVNTSAGLIATTSTPSATWTLSLAEQAYNYSANNTESLRGDHSENVASGSWTVNINCTPTARPLAGIVFEASGVATSSSLGATPMHATAAAASTAQPGSLTPTSGSILYCIMTNSSGNTVVCTINSTFTTAPAGGAGTCWDGTNSFERAGGAYKSNVSAAENPTFTESSGTANWLVALVEFLAAAGGGAAAVQPPMRTLRGAGI